MPTVEIRHFHLFCGLGGGAKGFNRGRARIGSLTARMRCIGGVDCDPDAIRDFGRLTGARGTVLDLFSREQYTAFHGHEPPAGWREATPADIRTAAGGERPHIIFASPPCKGFSSLLPERRARATRYQALNGLAVRGIWLALEAWRDDPAEFVLLENVPRIQRRGRHLLDQIIGLLGAYGYAVTETVHDCGELAGLAQSRRRFLLVARHRDKVPPFLYEPPRRPLRAVGDVLGRMPPPGGEDADPMHTLPRLQWKTWVRLAFVEAGKDWRSLERLRVQDGVLVDYALVPERQWQRTVLGVVPWDGHVGTITGNARPGAGAFSVADPRWRGHQYGQYGVRRWNAPMGAISGQSAPGGGRYAIADPRIDAGRRYPHLWRIVPMGPDGLPVPDVRTGMTSDRPHYRTGGQYGVVPWDGVTGAVTAHAQHDSGRWSVADPRVGWAACAYRSKLRVTRWDQPAGTVTGSTRPASGAPSVADPRIMAAGTCPAPEALPGPADRLVALIVAEDGTWHRPFTTLELAALQGLIDPEESLALSGSRDGAWRERIGNAVPPPAAQAIASVMARTLLMAWTGQAAILTTEPVWVRRLIASVSLPG